MRFCVHLLLYFVLGCAVEECIIMDWLMLVKYRVIE